ncbi:cyclic nucleotide-binding domain-containing protein [Bacteroidota bacterium]
MKEYKVGEKEIFKMLTSKQVSKISDYGQIRNYDVGDIIFEHKAEAKSIYFLLSGEVALRLPSRKDQSPKSFSLEIDRIKEHGVFGPGKLFGVKRYITRARATKRSRVLNIDADDFMTIMKENNSEFVVMAYLAKIYFQRYIHTMKELQQHMEQIGKPEK